MPTTRLLIREKKRYAEKGAPAIATGFIEVLRYSYHPRAEKKVQLKYLGLFRRDAQPAEALWKKLKPDEVAVLRDWVEQRDAAATEAAIAAAPTTAQPTLELLPQWARNQLSKVDTPAFEQAQTLTQTLLAQMAEFEKAAARSRLVSWKPNIDLLMGRLDEARLFFDQPIWHLPASEQKRINDSRAALLKRLEPLIQTLKRKDK